jgi:hypothetical protein
MSLPKIAEPSPHTEPTAWRDVTPARRPLTHRAAVLLIALVWGLASLVAGPVVPGTPSPTAHWKADPIYLGRPITTWGDPPHYLATVNSLVADGDLDLRNNYDRARADEWDVGTRFRGSDLDRHVETDLQGRQLSFHSPYLPLLLAPAAWPFRGTEWVESVCIWVTLAAILLGLAWWGRVAGLPPSWLVALCLATPLWVYARDVYTEPYQALAWGALLVLRDPLVLFAITVGAVLLKIPFAVVPLALGAVLAWRGDRRRGALLIGASVLAVLIAFATAQYVFLDSDHFSLFHLGGKLRRPDAMFRLRIDGVFGLLFSPENGLLPFCPFLLLGLPALRRDALLAVPALGYFLLHATYSGWTAGAGFSARYLIPMLPVLVLAVSRARPRGWLTGALVGYSAVFAVIAGLLPVAAYDKTPWGMLTFLAQRIGWVTG